MRSMSEAVRATAPTTVGAAAVDRAEATKPNSMGFLGARSITVFDTVVVRFHEVDAYNIVHNVNYFNYFDLGRFNIVTRFLRREPPPEIGPYLFLVLRADCKFASPARMADELLIETRFEFDSERRGGKLEFRHAALRKKGRQLLAEGTSVLGICDREHRLQARLPESVRNYCMERIAHYGRTPDPGVRLARIKRKSGTDGPVAGGEER